GTIWFVLRKQARQPARVLLAPGDPEPVSPIASTSPSGRRACWVAGACVGSAVACVAWSVSRSEGVSTELFFGAGSMLLAGVAAGVSALLARLERSGVSGRLSLTAMGIRSCPRRRTRSLAGVALMASGSFLV